MQPQPNSQTPIVIYQSADGSAGRGDRLVIAKAMAELFGKNIRTISEHIRNVFKEGELVELSVIRNFRIVRQEGQRQVEREIEYLAKIVAVRESPLAR